MSQTLFPLRPLPILPRCPLQTLDGREFQPHIPFRLLRIVDEIRAAGGRAYLVGGWVRDSLLGHDCRDYDIEVYHLDQETLLTILSAHGRPNLVGKAFGVIHLAMRGLHLDFSFPRTENKVGSGHRGFVVQTHPDLSFATAALRRDFTVNAMGMELPSLELADPYGGKKDLQAKIMRHVGPAFAEDSLRVLRGVQFAARFCLRAAPETIALCRELSLTDLSRERIGEEFRKWLCKGVQPADGLDFFVQVGLNSMFSAINPLENSWEQRGLLLNALVIRRDALNPADGFVLMLAGLLYGNPVSSARQFLESWLPENDLLKRLPLVLQGTERLRAETSHHSFPEPALLRHIAADAQGLALPVALADTLLQLSTASSHSLQWYNKIQTLAESEGIWEKAPEPFLTGKILLQMGLAPGRQLGELIRESFAAQLDGVITSTAQAEQWAKAKIALR